MKQILVCVHDASPKHMERLHRIDAMLQRVGVGARYSMLVVPDFWGEWPMQDDAAYCNWLRGRAADGVEMILHGFYHRDTSTHEAGWDRFRSQVFTAREGEFLGLSYDDARARLQAGRAVVESALGRPIEGFVAPAWLYGEGAHAALRDEGFTFAEDQLRVWRPADRRVVVRGPVVSYASRDRRRIVGSLVWSRTATVVLQSTGLVRLAIHPHDFDIPALEAEIERALRVFLSQRTPMLYRDVVPAAA